MAPPIHRRTRKRKVLRTPKKPRLIKKQHKKKPEIEETPRKKDVGDESTSSSLCCLSGGGGDAPSSGCSTPKGQQFQIPEMSTCPWAPRRRRITTSCNALRRLPMSFFSHPDIELLFSFALHNDPTRPVCNS